MNPKLFIHNLMLAYIATGPIYWFLMVPYSFFQPLKMVVAFVLAASVLLIGYKEVFDRPGTLQRSGAYLVFGIIVLSIPAMAVNQQDLSLLYLARYLILLGMTVSFYWVLMDRQFVRRLPIVVACVMIPVTLLTVADWLLNLGMDGLSTEKYLHGRRLYQTGFGGGRTGWSHGLAIVGLFMLWLFGGRTDRLRYLFLATFVCTVLSQIACQSRGGLVVTALGAFGLLLYQRNFLAMILLAIIFAVFFIANPEVNWLEHLRIEALFKTGEDFTTGRGEQYTLAIALLDDPITMFMGLGPKGYKPYFESKLLEVEIHNVWLRLLIEYGIFIVLFIIGYLIKSFYSMIKKNTTVIPIVIILIVGLISTLFEPNAIFYSFQAHLLWWLLFVAAKMNIHSRFLQSEPPDTA